MEQKIDQSADQKGEKVANGQDKSHEPHKVQASALQQMLTDDPGAFQEALIKSGLMLGGIVSLMMEGNKKKTLRGKLAGLDDEGIVLEGSNGKLYHNKLSEVKEIEVFGEGQKYASHELYFPIYGKTLDQLKPALADLLQGKEVYASNWLMKKNGSEEAQRFDGAIRLYRDPESHNVRMSFSEKQKELQRPERVENILITDDKWEAIKSKKGLEVKFEYVNDRKEHIQQPARIYVDSKLNRVRYTRIARPIVQKATDAQVEAWAKIQAQSPMGRIFDAVKKLWDKGYSDAWTQPQDINREIVLMKNDQGKVSIAFKNPAKLEGPHLKATTGLDADFVKSYSAAVEFLAGYLQSNGLTMAAEPQGQYQKAGSDAQKGETRAGETKQAQKPKNRRQKVN